MLVSAFLAVAFVLAFAAAIAVSTAAHADIYLFESRPPDRNAGVHWQPGQSLRFELNTIGFRRAAHEVGPACSGYIGEEPTIQLNVDSTGSGVIRVESNADPVIVVVGPDGEIFCNDDYQGLNPGLDLEFVAGSWEVWVGSFNEGASFPYTLVLE